MPGSNNVLDNGEKLHFKAYDSAINHLAGFGDSLITTSQSHLSFLVH